MTNWSVFRATIFYIFVHVRISLVHVFPYIYTATQSFLRSQTAFQPYCPFVLLFPWIRTKTHSFIFRLLRRFLFLSQHAPVYRMHPIIA